MKALVDLKLPISAPEALKGDAAWKQVEKALYEFARDVRRAIEDISPEVGTWTPVDGSGAGLSFSSAAGSYTKIGRLVVATAGVVYPANASGANAAVGGLPYTIGVSNHPASCYITPDPISTLALGATTTTVALLVAASGGAARLNNTLAGDTVVFTLVYET